MQAKAVYADTSFLMSHYINDDHTDRARYLIGENPSALRISRLCILEFHTAVWRKVGSEDFTRTHAERVLRLFERQTADGWFVVTNLSEHVIYERAKSLAAAYPSDLKVRSLDILHVAHATEGGADEILDV